MSRKLQPQQPGAFVQLPETFLSYLACTLPFKDILNLSLTCKRLRTLAQPHLARSISCVNCLSPLADASTAGVDSRGFEVSLFPESLESYCLGDPENLTNVQFAQPRQDKSSIRGITAVVHSRPKTVVARQVYCSCCRLQLGLHIVSIDGFTSSSEYTLENWRLSPVVGNVFVLKTAICSTKKQHSGHHMEDRSLPGPHWREFNHYFRQPYVPVVYYCRNQLMGRPRNTDDIQVPIYLNDRSASGICGAVIYEQRAILSRDHYWKFPGEQGPSPCIRADEILDRLPSRLSRQEQNVLALIFQDEWEERNHFGATLVNHVESPNLDPSKPRRMDLAQGKMDICDVACGRCGGLVGWRFWRGLENVDGTDSLENNFYCGRFGFVNRVVGLYEYRQGTKGYPKSRKHIPIYDMDKDWFLVPG